MNRVSTCIYLVLLIFSLPKIRAETSNIAIINGQGVSLASFETEFARQTVFFQKKGIPLTSFFKRRIAKNVLLTLIDLKLLEQTNANTTLNKDVQKRWFHDPNNQLTNVLDIAMFKTQLRDPNQVLTSNGKLLRQVASDTNAIARLMDHKLADSDLFRAVIDGNNLLQWQDNQPCPKCRNPILSAYYMKHKQAYLLAEQRAIHHIVIANHKNDQVYNRLNTRTQVEALHRQLQTSQEDPTPTLRRWKNLITSHSKRFVQRNVLPRLFETAIFRLKNKQTSAILKHNTAYHLFYLYQIYPKTRLPFKLIKKQLKREQRQRGLLEQSRLSLKKLRKKAKITVDRSFARRHQLVKRNFWSFRDRL